MCPTGHKVMCLPEVGSSYSLSGKMKSMVLKECKRYVLEYFHLQ